MTPLLSHSTLLVSGSYPWSFQVVTHRLSGARHRLGIYLWLSISTVHHQRTTRDPGRCVADSLCRYRCGECRADTAMVNIEPISLWRRT